MELKDMIQEDTKPKTPKRVVETPPALQEVMECVETPDGLIVSSVERQIIEYILTGISIPQIAYKLSVPEGHIRTLIRKPKVKEYLQTLRESLVEVDQLMLTGTLRKMLQSKIDNLEDPNDFSQLTKKDTLDVIKVFLDTNNATIKAQKEDETQSVFVDIYAKVMN